MDLLEVKSRIAEALVESVFRRARYEITWLTREAMPLRVGREDFSPHFRVARESKHGHPREFLVEVKYRPAIEQYLSVENQRGDKSIFLMARQKWSNLYFVFVSDRPEPGRSCFQVVSLQSHQAGARFATVDLAEEKELGLFRHNVEDHEKLVRRIFALLTGA
ncbi:MAG: hypothetical protein HY724_10105 [Candidatus Rokubacteria bacterium]|nr:hypothetical protein [Candidatus Rokubacteria bacterium]